MNALEAIEFIRPAIEGGRAGTWADLGAGAGTFSRAIADLIGHDGRVLAIDRDPGAVAELARTAAARPAGSAAILPVQGDFREPESIQALAELSLDGVLFANALHFVERPEAVLARVASFLGPGGRVVVIEYDRVTANPWVPHPIAAGRLSDVMHAAGLGEPEVVARRPSRYHRSMYCAVADRLR